MANIALLSLSRENARPDPAGVRASISDRSPARLPSALSLAGQGRLGADKARRRSARPEVGSLVKKERERGNRPVAAAAPSAPAATLLRARRPYLAPHRCTSAPGAGARLAQIGAAQGRRQADTRATTAWRHRDARRARESDKKRKRRARRPSPRPYGCEQHGACPWRLTPGTGTPT